MTTRSAALLLGIVPWALLGCNDAAEETPETIQTNIALRPFQGCAELETYIEDTAVREMRTSIDSWDQGWGWGWRGGPTLDAAVPESGASDDASQRSAPRDYTDTNTQVEGVDEADFVKTDGNRIFVLSGRKLYLTQSWPPEELAVRSSLELEGWPLEMFLDEQGRAVVFSSWWPEQDLGQDIYCGPWGCGLDHVYTRVTVVDTSGDRLTVERELFHPGSYVSSRRIGGAIRLVLRSHLRGPRGVRYWPDDFRGDPQRDREAFEAALEQLKDDNEALIRAQSLNDWIPRAFWRSGSGSSPADTTLSFDCASFHRPNAPVRLGLATVATLDLSGSTVGENRVSVLGEVGEIYASRDTLFLASPHWWWFPRAGQTTHTYLHAFDIRDPSRARYVGSGGVPGYLLDQFSMDEHLGYLRVATTVEHRVPDGEWWQTETSNRVTVLGPSGGRLVEVGAVTGIAPTERITSARFVGNKGFVVTFEQIDPLFTLDLSNPFDPVVVGELKVPGFSTYIHPLDDHHLLTIGVDLPEPDANGNVDWSQRAMKLTVFDVSDFERPVEEHVATVGTAYGWSEAGWNHKAFNYFPARRMLAIPFSDYQPRAADYWGSFVSDLRLFEIDLETEVDPETGIQPQGRVAMRDLFIEHHYREWSWRYSPWIRRSVMADDYAYAISDAGIRVVDMRAPERTIATARFDIFRAD